jgi:2'-5' RNA ligase
MRPIRTFIAVETPPNVVGRVKQLTKALQPAGADVSWVAAENLHWTIKFLGDVRQLDLIDICRALHAVGEETPPFKLDVRGAGAFPNLARPRTLWLGAGQLAPGIIRLADAVETHMTEIGFRRESRHFEPHLTIGRVRAGGPSLDALGELLAGLADFEGGEMEVDEVVLFSSDLQPQGPIYEALERVELTGRA